MDAKAAEPAAAGFRRHALSHLRSEATGIRTRPRQGGTLSGAPGLSRGFDARPRAKATAARLTQTHPCWAGVVTVRPSSSGFTVIWQQRREFGFTSKAKSSMSSSIWLRAPTFSTQASSR